MFFAAIAFSLVFAMRAAWALSTVCAFDGSAGLFGGGGSFACAAACKRERSAKDIHIQSRHGRFAETDSAQGDNACFDSQSHDQLQVKTRMNQLSILPLAFGNSTQRPWYSSMISSDVVSISTLLPVREGSMAGGSERRAASNER